MIMKSRCKGIAIKKQSACKCSHRQDQSLVSEVVVYAKNIRRRRNKIQDRPKFSLGNPVVSTD